MIAFTTLLSKQTNPWFKSYARKSTKYHMKWIAYMPLAVSEYECYIVSKVSSSMYMFDFNLFYLYFTVTHKIFQMDTIIFWLIQYIWMKYEFSVKL